MIRIEEKSSTDSYLTKNIISLVFVGLILLLIPFFILFTQSPDEKGFEYDTALYGPHSIDGGFGITISRKGVYYIDNQQRTNGEIAKIIEEKLQNRDNKDIPMTVWIVPHEKSKMQDLTRIMDYLNQEFSDTINVSIIGKKS